MREQKKSSFSPPALGGASLLVIFAVLALTIFALLSLSTVRADSRLSEASAQAIQDYYAADCRAQECLARLRAGEDPWDLEGVSVINYLIRRGDTIYSYTIPISSTQELQVEVRVNGTDYEVLRWQAAPIGEWETDDGIELWDMELY